MKFIAGRHDKYYAMDGMYQLEKEAYKMWTLSIYDFASEKYVKIGEFSSGYEAEEFANKYQKETN